MNTTLQTIFSDFPDLLNKLKHCGYTQFLEEIVENYLETGDKMLYNKFYDYFLALLDHESLVSSSIRAPESVNVVDIMNQDSILFRKYGGHPQAAGFTTEFENLILIKQLFLDNLSRLSKTSKPISQRSNTIEVDTSFFDNSFLNEILDLDPFGQDFPFPLLSYKVNTNIDKIQISPLGSGTHYKINIDTQKFIYFNVANDQVKLIHQIQDGKINTFTLIFKISQNVWNNKVNFEFIIDKIDC